jgi:hypothetical protein
MISFHEISWQVGIAIVCLFLLLGKNKILLRRTSDFFLSVAPYVWSLFICLSAATAVISGRYIIATSIAWGLTFLVYTVKLVLGLKFGREAIEENGEVPEYLKKGKKFWKESRLSLVEIFLASIIDFQEAISFGVLGSALILHLFGEVGTTVLSIWLVGLAICWGISQLALCLLWMIPTTDK